MCVYICIHTYGHKSMLTAISRLSRQRRGKCSSEGSALYDALFHPTHPCSGSGSLMVRQSTPKSGSLGAGFLGAPPMSLIAAHVSAADHRTKVGDRKTALNWGAHRPRRYLLLGLLLGYLLLGLLLGNAVFLPGSSNSTRGPIL